MKDKISQKDVQSSSRYAKRYLKQQTGNIYNLINQNISEQAQNTADDSFSFLYDQQQLNRKRTKNRVQQDRQLTRQAIINLRKQKSQKLRSQIFGSGGGGSVKRDNTSSNFQTRRKKGKKGPKNHKKRDYDSYMQSKHHDLTELSEQQRLLLQIDSNLQDGQDYEDEEILNARFEQLDLETKRRYTKLQQELSVQKIDLKIKALKRLVDSQEFKKEIEGQFEGA